MLGDETQPADSDGATTGPRHAAPRKSLLTKLHVPAGKAVALAAMPTAVLMGMGFTPHLANADEAPKNTTFKPGPCVTQSDSPTPSASATAGGPQTAKGTTSKTSGKAAAKPTPSTGPTAGKPSPPPSPAAPKPGSTASPSAAATAKPKSGSASTSSVAKPAAPASPSPTASATAPDLLTGVGNLLGGLLGGGSSTPTPTPAPSTQTPAKPPAGTAPTPGPTATPTPTTSRPPAGSAKPPATGSTKASTPPSTGTAKDLVNGLTKTVKGAGSGAASAAKKAAKGATATPTPSAGGTQSYPCPTYDAKALADAKVEQGIPLLPDQPWTLKTSKLTLYGLAYHGIVQVKTHNGTVKDVLKFTATAIDIENLHQIVEAPNNTKTNVQAAAGSTSTIRNGTVTLYTESLSGKLLGLVPVTFTPKAPPPLTLPVLFFTDATVIQAGQFGGTLHVPGMHIFGTPN